MACPGVCPETHKSNCCREVNKILRESRTLLQRSGLSSVGASQVHGSYLAPTRWCGQERPLPWTHPFLALLWPSPPFTAAGTRQPGAHDLPSRAHSRYQRPWSCFPKWPWILFPNLPSSLLWVWTKGEQDSQNSHSQPCGWPGTRHGRQWKADRAFMCLPTRCPHGPHDTRPPQYRTKSEEKWPGVRVGVCRCTTRRGPRILNVASPSNHESTFLNGRRWNIFCLASC